jgi:hypothetical protein
MTQRLCLGVSHYGPSRTHSELRVTEEDGMRSIQLLFKPCAQAQCPVALRPCPALDSYPLPAEGAFDPVHT